MPVLGTRAPDFALSEPGTDREWRLADFGAEALVVVFTCNHCPYAQAVEERVIALARDFAGRADFVAISANDAGGFPDDAPEKMAQRAREKEYPFPYLYDESQATARAYGRRARQISSFTDPKGSSSIADASMTTGRNRRKYSARSCAMPSRQF